MASHVGRGFSKTESPGSAALRLVLRQRQRAEPQPPEARQVRPIELQYRVELQWRRQAGVTTAATGPSFPPQGAEAGALVAPPPRTTALETTVQAAASPAPTGGAGPAPLPALTERLAGELIRRVERHVRIQRERRGL